MNTVTKTFKDQIKAFNELYGLPVAEAPSFPFKAPNITLQVAERLEALQTILLDEVGEVDDILLMIERGEHPIDVLTAIADWLGDLQVYCASEMMKFGLDNEVMLGIIMASNMSKLGEDGKPIIKDGKVMKGPNYWKPEPQIKRYIQAASRQAAQKPETK